MSTLWAAAAVKPLSYHLLESRSISQMQCLCAVHTECTRRLRCTEFNLPFLLPSCGDWLEGMQSSDWHVVEELISPPSCKLRQSFRAKTPQLSDSSYRTTHSAGSLPEEALIDAVYSLIHSSLHLFCALFSSLYHQLSMPGTQLHFLLISMCLKTFWKPPASILLKSKSAKPTAASSSALVITWLCYSPSPQGHQTVQCETRSRPNSPCAHFAITKSPSFFFQCYVLLINLWETAQPLKNAITAVWNALESYILTACARLDCAS